MRNDNVIMINEPGKDVVELIVTSLINFNAGTEKIYGKPSSGR
jgi:hypothetical protein